MNRTLYIVLLITPFIFCGALIKGYPTNPPYVLFVLLGGYVPIITIIRMKYISGTWGQAFKILFGFFNTKEKLRIFTDK